MKRLLLLLFVCALSCPVWGQSNVWDDRTTTYKNDRIGVEWQIPFELTWQHRPVSGPDCYLKIRNDEIGVVLALTAKQILLNYDDIWKYSDMYKDEDVREMVQLSAKNLGFEYNSSFAKTITIDNKHAIQTVTDFVQYWPDYDISTHYITCIYEVFYVGYHYTFEILGMTVPDNEIEDFMEISHAIISGVRILYREDPLP